MQDKLLHSPSKSEKIEEHLDKMRKMFHPELDPMSKLTPEQKMELSKEKTNLILRMERSNKTMSMPMHGDSQADFEAQVADSLMAAIPATEQIPEDDPIMEATNYHERKETKPMQDESFPKFQYSIFVDAQKNAQIVIRANSFEEFKLLKSQADSILTFTTTSANQLAQQTVAPAPVYPTATAAAQAAQPVTPICAVHGTPMTWKTGTAKATGKPYAFWSCPTKNPDGSYCKYKPQ